ncbi:hypothetical protein [Pelomicrobium methylotrophicum]|uniref:Uncharacterized protein n=1 Tax=Pelomicrobium methylotrophicum TaxID=2602750 RepID=A0A5C7EHM2_9PROT|nr:hypothetical protein [Pelomicrobium methylotrophicum]TXF11561.1 hypothetical protein FR698_09485 [Pelomicrobium methylotrophicum]
MRQGIDPAVRPFVLALNKTGRFRTFASCQGHPLRPSWPYVAFYGALEDAQRLERMLRRAWAQGRFNYEWEVSGHFDGYCRPSFMVQIFDLQNDSSRTSLRVGKIRNDFLALAGVVEQFQERNEGSEANLIGKEKNGGSRDAKTDRDAQFLQALLANGPRTGAPASWTSGRFRDMFSAIFAWHGCRGSLPYPLQADIRTENLLDLSRWCRFVDGYDPLNLRSVEGRLCCLGYEGAGGWLSLRGNARWFLFSGELDLMARLVARMRRAQHAEPQALQVHWEASVRFDVAMNPILVLYWVGDRGCHEDAGTDMAIIARWFLDIVDKT